MKITHKNIHTMVDDVLLAGLVKILKAEGYTINSVSHSDLFENIDAGIKLGGAFDGVHLQVGNGYYYVGATRENSFAHIDGKLNLKAELQEALDFARGVCK